MLLLHFITRQPLSNNLGDVKDNQVAAFFLCKSQYYYQSMFVTYNILGDVTEDQVAAYFVCRSEYYCQSMFLELQ